MWSDAYFSSPAIQAAFDNFWKDTPGPDGVGVQEHYVKLWQWIAERYAHEPAILGYDIMNEPFMGSQAADMNKKMFVKGSELLTQMDPPVIISPEELAHKWITAPGRSEILSILSNADIYAKYIDSIGPDFAEFERTKLMDMYNRVSQAIRQVDRNHIIFMETTIMSNMGLFSGIEPILDQDGKRDPLQAYAPHGYDLVTDTKDVASANTERIKFIFQRHHKKAKQLNMPMLVGEWGAYGKSNALQAARVVVHQFENLLCSETYWTYEKDIDTYEIFPALKRPYPEITAGSLKQYHFDTKMNRFECVWVEDKDITEPGKIYIPYGMLLSMDDVILSPWYKGFTIEPLSSDSKNAFLIIQPTGKSIKRQIIIDLKKTI